MHPLRRLALGIALGTIYGLLVWPLACWSRFWYGSILPLRPDSRKASYWVPLNMASENRDLYEADGDGAFLPPLAGTKRFLLSWLLPCKKLCAPPKKSELSGDLYVLF